MTTPKRGKRPNGRRLIVSVSLDANHLDNLDSLATLLTGWRGRKITRSAALRFAVNVAKAAADGRDVGNLRRF